MRISTAYPQQFNVNSMFDQQGKFNETQLKISSGKKYLTPAENPSAAAYALGFKQSISETQQYQDNIDATEQRLRLEETSITSAIDAIQRLQELGLQGISDSGNSTISRNAIADEFEQINEHLIGLANTRNANGEYIFSGTKTTEMPFGKKTAVDSKLDVVTLAATELKNTISDQLPANAWTKFVTQKAVSAAYDFMLKNPTSSLEEAKAWAVSQDLSGDVTEGKLNAALNHKTFPTAWDSAWNDTAMVFNSKFNETFENLTNKKLPTHALQQSANLATSALNEAKVSYKATLANHTDAASATQTLSSQKADAWKDYITKQAVADAYQLVDKNYPKINIETALKQTAGNLESYDNVVNSPAGVDAGRNGLLAFRIAAKQTDSDYRNAFSAAFNTAFAEKEAEVKNPTLIDSASITVPTTNSVTESTSSARGVTEKYYFIGSGQGDFKLDYNMNGTPDKLDVYIDNNLVSTTEKPVSGTGTLTILPEKLTAGSQIKVVVTGHDDESAWDFNINYSGGIETTDARSAAISIAAAANSAFSAKLSDVIQTSSQAWSVYSGIDTKKDTLVVKDTTLSGTTTTDGTGTTAPVTINSVNKPSAFIYSGSNTQREIQIGGSRKIADSDTGISVFGPSNVTGKMLFDTVQNFADELRSDTPTLATLQELDDAMVRLSTVRSTIGARMNAMDRQKQSNQDFIINTQTALSQIEDLDYADAITKLNSQQLSLQAAQQSYAKVQGMSLFKFL